MSWNIDSAHSEVNFAVRHMMIAKVRGQFEKFDGTIEFDPKQPENTRVDVSIAVGSINTREEQRDKHLRSADFFDVENYPKMTFKSTRVEITGEKSARLTGDLTIRGETRPISLEVDYAGLAKSPWGTTSAGFSARTTLNREDWGLNWNQALETGGWLVGKEVEIFVEVELVKQEQEATEAA
jgi:polyisoprenoid-binding protein YceI